MGRGKDRPRHVGEWLAGNNELGLPSAAAAHVPDELALERDLPVDGGAVELEVLRDPGHGHPATAVVRRVEEQTDSADALLDWCRNCRFQSFCEELLQEAPDSLVVIEGRDEAPPVVPLAVLLVKAARWCG